MTHETKDYPDPFVFEWQVAGQGYEWVESVADSELRLAAADGPGRTFYSPARNSRLFLRFATLKQQHAEIKRFANRYGNLYCKYHPSEIVKRKGTFQSLEPLFGISFTRWKFEIEEMRRLVLMWNAIKRNYVQRLERVIQWDGDDEIRYSINRTSALPSSGGILASEDVDRPLLLRFRRLKGSLRITKPAQYVLQREINNKLNNLRITPQLAWARGTRNDNQPDHHQRLVFRPSDLLGAMWLQFARAVATEFMRIRTCACGCGRNFVVGPGAARVHKRTANERCRKRLSRCGKSSAVRHAAEG